MQIVVVSRLIFFDAQKVVVAKLAIIKVVAGLAVVDSVQEKVSVARSLHVKTVLVAQRESTAVAGRLDVTSLQGYAGMNE